MNYHPSSAIKGFCLLLITLSVINAACTKQKTPPESPAVLQVFNGLDDAKLVRVNMSGTHPIKYSTAYPIVARNTGKFNSSANIQPLAFYAPPDTLPKDKPVWEGDLELETGKIYSIFLYNGPAKGEAIFVKENFPRNVTDSVTFFRVANLSSSQPISVNLAGTPNGSLISNLEMAGLSGFIQLPVNRSTASYVFEVRDANTGVLLASHTVNDVNDFINRNLLFRTSWTLVLTGKQGETGNNLPRLTAMYHL